MAAFVADRHPATLAVLGALILNYSDQVQCTCASALSGESEYPRRPYIAGRRREIGDEGGGEQVRAFLGGFTMLVNVDVGEWGSGIADISLS